MKLRAIVLTASQSSLATHFVTPVAICAIVASEVRLMHVEAISRKKGIGKHYLLLVRIVICTHTAETR